MDPVINRVVTYSTSDEITIMEELSPIQNKSESRDSVGEEMRWMAESKFFSFHRPSDPFTCDERLLLIELLKYQRDVGRGSERD